MGKSVLLLTNAYPDFDSSYRGIFIKAMAERLHHEGYEVLVVTPKIYKRSRYYEERNGIKIYRFPFFAKDKLLIEYTKIPYFRMILYYATGSFVTNYAVLRNRCNVIHAHWAIPTGLIGVLVRTFLRMPLIVTIHGSDLRIAFERSGLLKKIFTHVCKNAVYLNCVSEAQKAKLEELGISNDKISIIPMSIDDAFWEIGKNRKNELKKSPSVILSNRNLLPNYNISLLIRAIPMVLKEEPETRFLIAGDGTEKRTLEEETKDLNIGSSVRFLGSVPHEQMPNLLSQADIYVSTSLHDGTSVSLLEALASGAFPVVTDIPANREWIVDGDNGFLFPGKNENLLARRIIAAIQDKRLLMQAYIKNQTLVEQKANSKENIERITGLYQNLK